MQNNFYQYLDIGFDVDINFLDDLIKEIPDLSVGCYKTPSEKYYDPTLVEFLDKLNLKIIRFDAMRLPAKKKAGDQGAVPIHYDGHLPNRKESKIVWAFGQDIGNVHWYELKSPEQKPHWLQIVENKSEGPSFQYYKPEECNLIYSAKIQNPTLLNVDILHSADNPSDFPHWYLTYSLAHKGTNAYASWDETYEIFKPYFK